MKPKRPLGGVIHTYRAYDPKSFPSPTQPPPDMVGTAFEHMLAFGSMRHLTEEELARAVRIDPRMIPQLGPSLEALMALLEERKRKILATYETGRVRKTADRDVEAYAAEMKPPKDLAEYFQNAVRDRQIYDTERLWYLLGDERSKFARQLVQLTSIMGDQYQVEELASKYEFTGREELTVPEALAIKEELESIDRLLEQLREAAKNAQIGIIDMEELSEFVDQAAIEELNQLHQQIQDYLREVAESQGLEQSREGYRLTPKAHRLFQSKLLSEIFSDLEAGRTGRHEGPIVGEGAVEVPQTKEYEFGDSVTHMDIPGSMINAMVRSGSETPVRMKPEDIVIHRTKNTPKCATAVVMDMSGSMRYDGQYINVKRMAIALDGLVRTEYPGDFLRFVEIYSVAALRHISEIPMLLPKPVSIHNPMVRLKYDLSDPDVSEAMLPQHFTNIQRGLQLARQVLSVQDTPNRQVVLITDGLPTAHFEQETLYLLYPPHPLTEEATMREARLCSREGITINIVLLPSWSQSHDDIQFAYRMAESTKGRVFFSAGRDLDRFVVHDYIHRRKQIIT